MFTFNKCSQLNSFTISRIRMHNAKAAKGHLAGCSLIIWWDGFGREWMHSRKFPSHGFRFFFVSQAFPCCCDGLWGPVNVQDSSSYFKMWIYEYLNLTTTKFLYICPHTVVSVPKHAPNMRSRNMFLISWKPIEVWFTSKYSPWLDCSADKKIDWSHDQSIIRLWSFYTIFKLKSIGCFICQFRN